MDERAVYHGLTDIFRDLFGDQSIMLAPQTTAEDVDGWDSFNNINMIVAAESRFGVKIDSSEIENLSNVGDLVRAIHRKLPKV
jgi:acyl carrier protein